MINIFFVNFQLRATEAGGRVPAPNGRFAPYAEHHYSRAGPAEVRAQAFARAQALADKALAEQALTKARGSGNDQASRGAAELEDGEIIE